MNIEHLEIPTGAVIIIRDPDNELEDQGVFEDVAAALHQLHPLSLVIQLSGDTTFETVDIETLKSMLEEIIAHQEQSG